MPPCCLPLPSHFMLPFATPHFGHEPAEGCAVARVSAALGRTARTRVVRRTVDGAPPSGLAAAAARTAAPRRDARRGLARGAARLGARPQSATDAMLRSTRHDTHAERACVCGWSPPAPACARRRPSVSTLRERSRRTRRRCVLAATPAQPRVRARSCACAVGEAPPLRVPDGGRPLAVCATLCGAAASRGLLRGAGRGVQQQCAALRRGQGR